MIPNCFNKTPSLLYCTRLKHGSNYFYFIQFHSIHLYNGSKTFGFLFLWTDILVILILTYVCTVCKCWKCFSRLFEKTKISSRLVIMNPSNPLSIINGSCWKIPGALTNPKSINKRDVFVRKPVYHQSMIIVVNIPSLTPHPPIIRKWTVPAYK